METSVRLSGLHCPSCVDKIRTALQRLAGVDSVEVSLNPPVARLRSSSAIDTVEIDAAVRSAGDYRAVRAALPAERAPDTPSDAPGAGSLYPLLLILGYLVGTVTVIAWSAGSLTLHTLMGGFMGGFFLVFSFFKLLDLRGFAESYRTYDLVAAAWPAWGFVYPFAELALGAAYVTSFLPWLTNSVTLTLMLLGAAGVLKALRDKRRIRCACLGTVLKLPLTHVTLVEDLVMAAMAGLMLLLPRAA